MLPKIHQLTVGIHDLSQVETIFTLVTSLATSQNSLKMVLVEKSCNFEKSLKGKAGFIS